MAKTKEQETVFELKYTVPNSKVEMFVGRMAGIKKLLEAKGDFEPCKVCGDDTMVRYNIKLKMTPICESCASSIMLQQAQWLTEQI